MSHSHKTVQLSNSLMNKNDILHAIFEFKYFQIKFNQLTANFIDIQFNLFCLNELIFDVC